ncbi:Oidioi.mRNA.OKI2018_I69.chr2.g7964.t1.cds [Oikopleura dioica]|uniref:Oidioi.mRNA.OKI2018_I69.chr2.g7964.t1.cds n=1 Tax=Oikopleura dioica TaxID=34765 RepID=A0ABN7T8V2_OIKDI|nr:Oidioi.mRNA.OKI2018_I69.chr2.g7964.t1.cds [Oikopleura dioica]
MQALKEQAEKECTAIKLNCTWLTLLGSNRYNSGGDCVDFKHGEKDFSGRELIEKHQKIGLRCISGALGWDQENSEIRAYFREQLKKDLEEKTIIAYVDGYEPPDFNSKRAKNDFKVEGYFNVRYVKCLNI